MKTRSACLTGIDRIEVRPRELSAGRDEVLVKTHLAGICGTDKNLYRGVFPRGEGLATEMRKNFDYPFFFGHEGGGTVVAVGDRVRNYAPGDRVMAFAWVDTYSEYFVAGEGDLERVPEGLDMDLACLGEPLGCAGLLGASAPKSSWATRWRSSAWASPARSWPRCSSARGAWKVIAVDVVEGKARPRPPAGRRRDDQRRKERPG